MVLLIPRWSILDPALREDAFLVGVLYFAHFRHSIGELHEQRMGVAAGQDYVHHLRLGFQSLCHDLRIEHSEPRLASQPIADRCRTLWC